MPRVIIRIVPFLFILSAKGAKASDESYAIYRTRQENTDKLIELIFDTAVKMSIASHTIPALCPILYLAIGYPTPDLWFTSFGIHEA